MGLGGLAWGNVIDLVDANNDVTSVNRARSLMRNLREGMQEGSSMGNPAHGRRESTEGVLGRPVSTP